MTRFRETINVYEMEYKLNESSPSGRILIAAEGPTDAADIAIGQIAAHNRLNEEAADQIMIFNVSLHSVQFR